MRIGYFLDMSYSYLDNSLFLIAVLGNSTKGACGGVGRGAERAWTLGLNSSSHLLAIKLWTSYFTSLSHILPLNEIIIPTSKIMYVKNPILHPITL